jgi:Uma2 family endonuclease
METSYNTPTGEPSAMGGPTWEVAHFFPLQGDWTEGRYLALPIPHRFELVDGRLEALPMSSWFHALISEYIYEQLKEYLKNHPVGRVAPSAIFVRLWQRQIRLPDLTFCFHEHMAVNRKKAQDGADLVIEVVSGEEKDRKRDLVEKPVVYAKAGITEYWIVDPETRTITVLALDGAAYREAGRYVDGQQATSPLLPGFVIDVTQAFAAAEK